MTVVYNTLNRKMIVAGAIIAIIVCDPKVDEAVSDGFTHTKSVSCVLYNHLYKVVIHILYNLYIKNYIISFNHLYKNLGSFNWIRFLYNNLGSMAWKSLILSNTCT